MGRIVGIDYGTKRVGLAVTDPLQMIANGLTTVHAKDVVNYLKEYCQQEEVDTFVVGLPLQNNNQPSESERHIGPFIKALRKQLPDIPVERIDERFTSVMAHQTMLMAGLSKKGRQNKALVDTISATLILQTYLDMRSR